MRVGNELFWGYDDFPYMELVLAGKDPLDSKEKAKWHALSIRLRSAGASAPNDLFDGGQKSLRETAQPSSSRPLAWLAANRIY